MNISELYAYLDHLYPKTLSCPWDNDGIMCCPDRLAEVKKVLITLDVTAEAVKYAAENGFQLIVSHHPLVFKGLKGIGEGNFISDKLISLIRNNIAAFSFHTRLDAAQNGVNDALAEAIGLLDVQTFSTEEGDFGRLGSLPVPMTLADFAAHCKKMLGAPSVFYIGKDDAPIEKVAVIGGDGKDFIADAMAFGADVYVTGQTSYNAMIDAAQTGMRIVEAGHYYTEFPVCRLLMDVLKQADPEIVCEIFDCNLIWQK